MSSIEVSLEEVAASLVLVGVAVAISRWRRAGLEADIGIAVLRSFLQLTAIGFVITAIFDVDSLLLVLGLLAVMVGFGAFTAGGRARHVPGTRCPKARGASRSTERARMSSASPLSDMCRWGVIGVRLSKRGARSSTGGSPLTFSTRTSEGRRSPRRAGLTGPLTSSPERSSQRRIWAGET